MSEQQLKEYKQIYKNISVPSHKVDENWKLLSSRLPTRKHLQHMYWVKYGFMFASVILVLLVGVTSAAQASQPGDVLYPVKVFSKPFISKIIGKPSVSNDKNSHNTNTTSNSSTNSQGKGKGNDKKNEESSRSIKGVSTHINVNKMLKDEAHILEEATIKNPHVTSVLKQSIKHIDQLNKKLNGDNADKSGNQNNKGQSDNSNQSHNSESQNNQSSNNQSGNSDHSQNPKK